MKNIVLSGLGAREYNNPVLQYGSCCLEAEIFTGVCSDVIVSSLFALPSFLYTVIDMEQWNQQ